MKGSKLKPSSEKIRVLVADDHAFITDLLKQNLEAEGDFICATVADHRAAMQQISRDGPYDVVLLDYRMSGMNGLDGLTAAIRANQGKPVGIITGVASKALVTDVIAAGGIGLIPKSLHARNVVNAIRIMALGETYVSREQHSGAYADPNTIEGITSLSPKEEVVLLEISTAKGNREIAETLGLTEGTVKMYVKNICKKLNANNRMEAVLIAQDAGII